MYQHEGRASFWFDHHSSLYWWSFDLEKFNEAMLEAEKNGTDNENARFEALTTSAAVQKIANCLPQPLYYQRNEVTDEAWYYFRIDFPHAGPAIKTTFTAGQLASAPEFKKRLLAQPGAMWLGAPKQLDAIMERWTYGIKRVETIDFSGYAKEHGAYIFRDLAVKDGRLYQLNEEDYFDLPKLAVKTLSHSVPLAINTDLSQFGADWISSLWTSFGPQGFVALAFWFGTLFAEQIRARQKSYPFLEVIGEAGSGKSTLINFLWKLVGRADYEGFDATNASQAALGRNLAQVGNLPIVLLESDRGAPGTAVGRPRGGIDWAEFKKLYNGNPYRSRGVKNSGLDTYEPPFRGSIVIEQNLAVTGDQAVIERLLHMEFDTRGHSDISRAAAERLERMPVEAVSGFLLKAILAEKEMLALFWERCKYHEEVFGANPAIRKFRIIRNHAQIAALVDCLGRLLGLDAEEHIEPTQILVTAMAAERQQAINQEHPVVERFWELYDYIEDTAEFPILNHAAEKSRVIAVNLPHFEEVCLARKLTPPDIGDLKRCLRLSKNPRFLANKTVNSALRKFDGSSVNGGGKSVKCWVFEGKS
jgi:hypothetical protein